MNIIHTCVNHLNSQQGDGHQGYGQQGDGHQGRGREC